MGKKHPLYMSYVKCEIDTEIEVEIPLCCLSWVGGRECRECCEMLWLESFYWRVGGRRQEDVVDVVCCCVRVS